MTTRTLWGDAFVAGARRQRVAVTVDEEGVVGRCEIDVAAPAGAERHAGLLVPGFVDLHVHGGAGADFMDADAAGNREILRLHARHGTAGLAATTLSGSRQEVTAAVAAAHRIADDPPPDGAAIFGVHLEGPYLAPVRAGAQDPASLRDPDPDELREWIAAAGDLPIVATIAPERPGARELVGRFRERVRFSIGHTEADLAVATEAFAAGARQVTHLFNAMPGLHHRQPGPIGAAALDERVVVELIADGVHVHPSLLRIAGATFADRLALITDAMRACGLGDGRYRLLRHEVEVAGNEARLADGTLAGSVLTMAGAVRTMVRRAGFPLDEVVPWATEIPARALGVADRAGRIAVGRSADLVLLDDDLGVERIWIRGREIEPAPEALG